MTAEAAGHVAAANPAPRVLSEEALARLPGSRWIWIVVWACVPWANAGVNRLLGFEPSDVWDQGRTLLILNYAALSVAMVLTLWGCGRLAARQATIRAAASGFLSGSWPAQREPNAVLGPLVAATATAVVFGAGALVRDGWAAAALRGVTWLVLGVAIWSFIWAYASLLLELDRVGQGCLTPDLSDPVLGLRSLGAASFTGLWMLFAWLVPVLLTALPDLAGVTIGLLILAGGLLTYFLSLYRLHRQMVDVKAREVAIARDLYRQAYEPVRQAQTLEALERQDRMLAAADTLDKRAQAIHEWPIDDGTLARVVTIATSVVAMTIGRLILDPLGL